MIKLLFIEDDKVDQISFERFVKNRQLLYDYTIISSIAEAKKAIANRIFDIIVADYLLYDGTAFDVFDIAKNVPIIVITGHGDEAIAVKAIKNGAYDYLVKDNEYNYLEVLPSTVDKAISYNKYDELKKLNVKLVQEVAKRKEIEKSLVERIGITTLMADIGMAVIKAGNLREILRCCLEILVKYFDAALVRIWILNKEKNMLELEASAGMYTHIDGQHSRIPFSKSKQGCITPVQKHHFTNAVIGNNQIHDQKWAKTEGIIAFSSYPLIFENQQVGVMGLFARKPLSVVTIQSILSVTNSIGLCIGRKKIEEELLATKDQLQSIIDNTTAIVYLKDKKGRFVLVNRKFEELFHTTKDKIIGKTNEDIFPDHKILTDRLKVNDNKVLKTLKPIEIEESVPLDDGLHTYLSTKFPLSYATNLPYGVCTISTDITDRKRSEKEIFNIEELARQRLGRELHDGLGQLLTGIAFKSEMLHLDLKDKGLNQADQAAEIEELVNNAINETRTLSKGALILDNESESLITIIKELALNVKKIYGIECFFNYDDDISLKDLSIANHLYRIVQEAVNNSIKHAKTDQINIDLMLKNGKTLIKVKDYGIGITDSPKKKSGIGLRTMRHRADMIGASLNIERNTGGGTVVTCSIE